MNPWPGRWREWVGLWETGPRVTIDLLPPQVQSVDIAAFNKI